MPQAQGWRSRNLYRWAPQIRREDGFVRLVWGLGTRAVDRVGNDYPRLIALSHPLLRPSTELAAIKHYSQQFIDVIDLEDNQFKSLPITDVLNANYGPLRYIAQVEEDGVISSLRTRYVRGENTQLVITFEDLLLRTPFAERIRNILLILEQHYRAPVDLNLPFLCVKTARASLTCVLPSCNAGRRATRSMQPRRCPRICLQDIVFQTRFIVRRGASPGGYYPICAARGYLFAQP